LIGAPPLEVAAAHAIGFPDLKGTGECPDDVTSIEGVCGETGRTRGLAHCSVSAWWLPSAAKNRGQLLTSRSAIDGIGNRRFAVSCDKAADSAMSVRKTWSDRARNISLLGSDRVYRATSRMCRVMERMLKRSAVRAKRQLPRFTRMARQPITTVPSYFP
jgi:hypothetical protein